MDPVTGLLRVPDVIDIVDHEVGMGVAITGDQFAMRLVGFPEHLLVEAETGRHDKQHLEISFQQEVDMGL